ncbi:MULTISPECIES: DUF3429 domain-containing protein [Idiomarinaceae]|uniref:DUF3429 domain-containing protein n=1 Tax=Pseudidiomarina fusca TaxID=2965078 RepID=A0ABU3KUY4_9GAMM|nr:MULTISPECIES: DUF3429 domain-containing protein [Idiomarinaceae]MDT7525294.1 DUF3429 domain-containing protein [Pseudidiomarina sp. GXY010]MRJ41157.1 DUF3429 family protein [Idiomarina sp. FeN1]NCU56322.1 DUF3429 family protein [Idiomarina sp. FenA--70]NCU59341.1 DUF3429 family protein [Idiomarina sp. FenBw--71]UUN12516.1 DUF3429 domain-containing protein [Idiomarina loihiensis]
MQLTTQYTAQRLGFAGLIPFIGLTLLALLDIYGAQAIQLFIIYSAIIFSFLGGVHWGLSLQQPQQDQSRNLQWSMFPSVTGFLLLVWQALPWCSDTQLASLAILALLHLFWLNYERRKLSEHGWYLELRSRLTFTVVALHVILLIISI